MARGDGTGIRRPKVLSWSRPTPCSSSMEAIASALKDVADIDPTFMRAEDKKAALLGLSALGAELEELRLRVLASADDLAADEGARDPAAWLAHHARLDSASARRQLRPARALDGRWHGVRRALGQGTINADQAAVVVRALDDLPSDIGSEVRGRAEERLVGEAARFGPRELRILGRRVLGAVSPDEADAHERRLRQREDQQAERTTYLATRRNGDGTTEIRARVSDYLARRLLTYLEAFTSPRVTGDDRRPYEQRLGFAFEAFLEAVDPARLPLHGGDATTVMVTVDLETLRTGLGTALVGDEPITAAQARRLACQAKIIPAVLDGASKPLDLGRADRLFRPHQRKAMAITQPTCRAVGCEIPAVWCEAHHGGIPWALGGRTDLADGVLLCAFHHHRAHDHRYELRRQPDGRCRFHRRS